MGGIVLRFCSCHKKEIRKEGRNWKIGDRKILLESLSSLCQPSMGTRTSAVAEVVGCRYSEEATGNLLQSPIAK